MSIEAMKQALEFLEDNQELVADNERHLYVMGYNGFIEKLRQAIADLEKQKPVAWGNLANWCLDSDRVLITDKEAAEKYHRDVYDLTPLYEHPQPKREWIGLTDEDIEQEFGFIDEMLRDYAYRIEAKLKQKNGYAEEKNT